MEIKRGDKGKTINSIDNYSAFLGRVKSGELRIDSLGRVWRLKHRNSHSGLEKILPRRAELKMKDGYLKISGGEDGRSITALAHRLIWMHLHGEIPKGLEINHKNGIKDDNRIENLELVTPKENMKHASEVLGKLKGGLITGEMNPSGKLKNTDVISIKKMLREGRKCSEIAPIFGVSKSCIYQINRGDIWDHINDN